MADIDLSTVIRDWIIENGYGKPFDMPDVTFHVPWGAPPNVNTAVGSDAIFDCPAGFCALIVREQDVLVLRIDFTSDAHCIVKLGVEPLGIASMADPTGLEELVDIITRPKGFCRVPNDCS